MRYRALITIGLLAHVVPLPAAAQPVTGGIKAGVVFASVPNFESVTDLSTSVRTGVTGGGFVRFAIGKRFALQPEVLYTQKGVEGEESGAKITVELAYLEVPLLARYDFGAGTTRGYVFGGPSFALELDAVSKSSFGGESHEEDIGDDVERFEFALVAGAGVEFGRFLVEGRYSEGLTDIPKGDTDLDESLRSRTFAILAGIRF